MATILVICAHSDDQIFGAGGTLAKYANEGDKIRTVILSYGESGTFWIKEHITIQTRIEESEHADKVIKGSGVSFLDLKEGKFEEDAAKKKSVQELADIIKEEKPSKIFTHSEDDPHTDHRGTLKLVLAALEKTKKEVPVYSFNVWNIFNLKKDKPRLVVDVSETFSTKLKALKCFKSQRLSIISLLWSVYAKAFFHGIQNNYKWAEVFFRAK